MAYIKPDRYNNPDFWTEYTLDPTPREFFCDGDGGYIGHLVTVREFRNRTAVSAHRVPVFTHEQMLVCQEIQNALADEWDDAYDRLEYSYSEDTWIDRYGDEPVEYIEQWTIDGITVHALGYGLGWPWDWDD